MSNEITKTYYLTDKLDNDFPPEFVWSTNKRYIEVQSCTMVRSGNPEEKQRAIMMHADFVQRDAYQDCGVCFCNDVKAKYKKYEYRGTKDCFKLWFTDEAPVKKTIYNITIKMVDDTIPFEEMFFYTNWEQAINIITNKIPNKKDEIDRLYAQLLATNFDINSKLLYLSRYTHSGFKPNSYYVFDLVDHCYKLYGIWKPDEITDGPDINIEEDNGIIVKTITTTYKDFNFNRIVTKTETITYRLIDDDYKFVAEFMLTY